MKKLVKLVLLSALLLPPLTVYADTAAKVTCMDGSSSKGGKGACSKHGGINKEAATVTPATETPAPAPAKAKSTTTSTSTTTTTKPSNTDATGATAQCKDNTYSHAKNHKGACSKHGGVANWLDK